MEPEILEMCVCVWVGSGGGGEEWLEPIIMEKRGAESGIRAPKTVLWCFPKLPMQEACPASPSAKSKGKDSIFPIWSLCSLLLF